MNEQQLTNKPTTVISYLTTALVFLLAVGSFTLSFFNLWDTALSLGILPRLAWIWPLLVDFALIVFSLAVVRANLYSERGFWPWLLVFVYTGATIGFNIFHAPANLAAQVVAIVAPVSLFLSFETLMSMLKSGVKRNGLVLSIGEISAKLSELEGFYQAKKDRLESEIEQTRQARLAEIEADRLRLTEEIGQLESEQARLNEELEVKAKALDTYRQDIEAKREELKALDSGQLKIYVPDNLSIDQRRQLVDKMSQEGMTIEAIAAALGYSPGTVKNDKKANGTIKPLEEIAAESGHSRNGDHGAAKGVK